jgi:hypothetical protein
VEKEFDWRSDARNWKVSDVFGKEIKVKFIKKF